MVTPSNVPGMGEVALPANPGTLDGFANQEVGSGDLAMPAPKKKKKLKNIKSYEDFNVLEFSKYVYKELELEDNARQYKLLKQSFHHFLDVYQEYGIADDRDRVIRIFLSDVINNMISKITKDLEIFVYEDGISFTLKIYNYNNDRFYFMRKRPKNAKINGALFLEDSDLYLSEIKRLAKIEWDKLNSYKYDDIFADLELVGVNSSDISKNRELIEKKKELYYKIRAKADLYVVYDIFDILEDEKVLIYLISVDTKVYHVYFHLIDINSRKYKLSLVYNHRKVIREIHFRKDGYVVAFMEMLDVIENNVLSNE
jgi:hypothetical protein